MKTDNYLNLCVEQAAKSPLHYRHGAIVVRGGKVIGQGYNCYRPGFDGGSLKSGRIANTHLDGDAIAALKAKLKKKDKDHPQSQQDGGGNFIPFEGMSRGGGPNVNTPLSMHSEMMALYSALAASSTLSSTAFSREKLCFKLPREDKRKSRLRRDVLLAYVAAICEASPGSGKWQVQECGFETGAHQPGQAGESQLQQRQGGGQGGRGAAGGAKWSVSSRRAWCETSLEEELEEETSERESVRVRGGVWSVRGSRTSSTPTVTAICV
jgi:deoxycytidylate deaminase